jgi:hypothetical protein
MLRYQHTPLQSVSLGASRIERLAAWPLLGVCLLLAFGLGTLAGAAAFFFLDGVSLGF